MFNFNEPGSIEPIQTVEPVIENTPAVQTTSVTTVVNTPIEYPVINDNAWKCCEKLSRSLLVPESIRTTDLEDHTADLYMLMSLGHSLGFDLMQSLQSLFILPGSSRPSLYTSAKRALVLRNGGIFEREEFDEGTQTAIVTINRNGQRITRSFSVIQACAMGRMYQDPNDGQYKGCVTKNGKPSPWAMDYRNMCLTRAISRACDAAYPDVLMGLPSYEDTVDYSQPVEVVQTVSANAETLSETGINPQLASIVKPKRTKKTEINNEPFTV